MASSFIGLPVLLSLRSGLSLRGTVQSVNAVQGTIVLSSSHLFQPGQDTEREEEGEYLGTRAVGRDEVKGLEVVSVPNKGIQQQQQQPRESYAPSPSYDLPAQSPLYTSLEEDLSSSPGPGSRQQKQKTPRRNGGGGRKAKGQQYGAGGGFETGNEADESTAGWEEGRGSRGGDGTRRRNAPQSSHSQSSSYHSQQQQQQPHPHPQQPSFDEEFDFGAGLRSFNKKAVFEEIRAQDLTDPSSLLVSHNRSSPHPHASNPKMVKMRPNESVLSSDELERQQEEGRVAFEKLAMFGREGDESGEEEGEEEGMITAPEEEEEEQPEQGGGSGWVSKRSGRQVKAVSRREWDEVLGVADIESLPSPSARLHTSAHSLTSFLLSLPSSSTTSIVLLINAPTKGELVLRAGVHLLNRGWKVTAWVSKGVSGGMGEGLKEGLRVFSTSSGRIVRSLGDLSPSYDMIIDALSDDEEGVQMSVEEMAAARWANERDAEVVCVDCPWGRERESGAPLTPTPLQPTYLLSLGALRHLSITLASQSSSAPELAVLDVGIPPHLWARCGVQGFEPAGGQSGMVWEEGWWTGVVWR